MTDLSEAQPTAPGAAMRAGPARPANIDRLLVWVGTFVLVVYLALSGGGYDIVVRSEIGIVVWWLVLLGVLIGALPRVRLRRTAWIAVALLAGFLLWTWIALAWTGSEELTLDEVARVSTYLGVLILGLCVVDQRTVRPILGALASAIALVCAAAVLSKLTPSLFPANGASDKFYETARLSYPFDYADAVGEFAALGLPLLLWVATSGRTVLSRAAGAAGLPVVLLCLAMTVSRGGILAAAVGLIAFVALMPNRIPRLPTIALAGVGIGLLMVALLHRPALRDQLGVAPGSERHSMLVILCVVILATAIAQALLVLAMRRLTRPAWSRISRGEAREITAAILAAVVLVVVISAAKGTITQAWHDFEQPNPAANSNQYFRLLSLAGSHRYQYWQVALRAFESAPLIGIGPGTFRFYWAQHQTLGEYVLNAHSLWIETLAEAGLVGIALIAGFFLFLIAAGSRRALRAAPEQRAIVAAAVATVVGFCGAAAFDWVWQIGVIPIVAMLLAVVVVGPEWQDRLSDGTEPVRAPPDTRPSSASGGIPRLLMRAPFVLGAALAICLIAVPLASTIAVRSSQTAAAHGDLRAALADADTAQRIEPAAASPRLQRALLLEQLDDVGGAEQAIAGAIVREPANSDLWLVASRIATEADKPKQALADYQRARELDPKSPLFG